MGYLQLHRAKADQRKWVLLFVFAYGIFTSYVGCGTAGLALFFAVENKLQNPW
jgi:hypothetical protein